MILLHNYRELREVDDDLKKVIGESPTLVVVGAQVNHHENSLLIFASDLHHRPHTSIPMNQ